jgi:hypothetical protein
MSLVFNPPKQCLLFLTLPPVCAGHNIHKYYFETLSTIITIMLVCPRCGTSNLHNRCSLLINLSQYCTGPIFLSNALTTGTSISRSYDGRHPLSMVTTFHQQVRHFNALEVNITLPTINTLHVMPSMSHLSSTQPDLAQLNLHYALSDDADYSQDNDNHNYFSVHGVDNIIIKKYSFLRNSFQLPPDVAFQVHCLSVISQHRGNNLNMFNQVIQCVSGHALHQSVNFRTLHIMSRVQLL